MATSPDGSLELLINTELCTPERVGPAHLVIAAGRIVWIGTTAVIHGTFEGARS